MICPEAVLLEDIVGVVAITSVQAQAYDKNNTNTRESI